MREVEGDLFDSSEAALGHGCNCAGAMGRGIATEFRQRWPEMYDRYRMLCKSGKFQPGDVFVWEAADRIIFNLGTQKSWRSKATISAIGSSARRMAALASDRGIDRVAIPRIGSGLGGLEWEDEVRPALLRATESQIELVVYTPTYSSIA